MMLSPKRQKRLAAIALLLSVSFMVFMLGGSGPVGPPYQDESLTAGPAPLLVVNQPAIREELKLTRTQVQRIRSAIDKQRPAVPGGEVPASGPRKARMGHKHQKVFLAEVLSPEQMNRLHQIILQHQGGLALNNRWTADELGLTEPQRKQAGAILEKLNRQLSLVRNPPGPERTKQVKEARAAAGTELLELLTPQQKNRWKELIGEPFAGEISVESLGWGLQGGRPPGLRPPGWVPRGEGVPGGKDSALDAPR
jgi:Spy/CpxP family protein refolding chaperone